MKIVSLLICVNLLFVVMTQNTTTNTTTPTTNTTTPTTNTTTPTTNTTTPTDNTTYPIDNSTVWPVDDNSTYTPADGTVDNPFYFNWTDYVLNTPLVEPDNYTNYNSSSLNMAMSTAFSRYWGESSLYYANNCTDDRVPAIFGANPNDNFAAYQEGCQLLVFDWTQAFAPYACNNWICGGSNQGSCAFSVDEWGFVQPKCSCLNGFYGPTCMFREVTYLNADRWVSAAWNWMALYLQNNNNTIRDPQVLSDAFDIFFQILVLDSNSVESDSKRYQNGVIAIYGNAIINAVVEYTEDLKNRFYGFMGSLAANIDSGISIDENDLLTNSPDNNYMSDYKEMERAPCDINNDMTFDFDNTTNSNSTPPVQPSQVQPSNNTLRFLIDLKGEEKVKRFLAVISKAVQPRKTPNKPSKKATPRRLTPNPDNAKATIPQATTSKLGSDKTISFVANKDPTTMSQLNGVSINSFVVTIKATDKNRVEYPFPKGGEPVSVYVPWAATPYTMSNNGSYASNCNIFSYNGTAWKQTQDCKIVSGNEKAAIMNCTLFDTVGIACKGATSKVTLGSSFISILGFLSYAIFALFIF